jgi:hypothetical protein
VWALPLVPAGVGLAVVTDSWRAIAERARARALDLEPVGVVRLELIRRKGPLSPAARECLDRALSHRSPAR